MVEPPRSALASSAATAPPAESGVASDAWTVVECHDLAATAKLLERLLAARVCAVFPADRPRVTWVRAGAAGFELRAVSPDVEPRPITVTIDAPWLADGSTLHDTAQGLRIEARPWLTPLIAVLGRSSLEVFRPDLAAWGVGRAGMNYCDLVPHRAGGQLIASRIRVPGSGPVPDYVHHHHVRFQLIYCLRGRVQLVYQDQGEPFELGPGDAVLQPPHIRHRVLQSWDDLEVLEVTCPSDHLTLVDHDLALPNDVIDPGRRWQGQRFVHHVAATATVAAQGAATVRNTGIDDATDGAADVRVLTAPAGRDVVRVAEGLRLAMMVHGDAMVSAGGQSSPMVSGDTALLPSGVPVTWACRDGCEWVEVTVAGTGTS
jgi:mannose-6-phosphate isomerase-like protein (cupin superfamily)